MRVATFNILHGRSLEDGLVDAQRFARAVERLDPDVLALQEVDRDQPRSMGVDLTAVAATAMGAISHRFAAALAGIPGGRWVAANGREQPGTASYGVALLSRFPVDNWRVVRLPALPGRVPYVWPHRRLPSLVRDEARVALVADVAAPIGRLSVVSTHLSFLPGWNVVQLRRLMWALDDRDGPLIVSGDFNMEARTAVRTTRLRPLLTASTFPAGDPVRQIDHLLGRGLDGSRGGEAVELPLSDHRALVAEIDDARLGPPT